VTSTIDKVVERLISSMSVEDLTTSIGLIPVFVLIVLLLQQELVRALDGPRLKSQMRAMGAIVFPLLFTFAVIVVTRAIDLISD
jgi:hypothetical protein